MKAARDKATAEAKAEREAERAKIASSLVLRTD